MPFPLAELVLRGSGLVPDFRMFQFDVAANLSILTKYLQQITTSWKHRHFLETPTFLLTTRRMIFWSEPGAVPEVQEEVDKHTGQPGAAARRWGCCARSRWRLQGLLRPLLPRNRTREPSRPGFPAASPAIMEHDFQTRFDCREGFCVYEKSFSTSQELEARFQTT